MAHRTRLKYTDEMRSYIWDRYAGRFALKTGGYSQDTGNEEVFIRDAYKKITKTRKTGKK